MQNHFIIEMLGLKDNNVKVWDISQGSDALIVELFTEKRQQKCPFCRCKTKRVHSYRIQPIQGPVLPNQQVKLFLRKRRYLCKDCGKDLLRTTSNGRSLSTLYHLSASRSFDVYIFQLI